MGGSSLTGAASVALLFSAACAARQPPPVAVPESARAGTTSVRVLEADQKPPPADVVVQRQAPAAIYLDFEFAFRIVEGRGQVLSR